MLKWSRRSERATLEERDVKRTFSGDALVRLESSPKCAPQRRLSERTSLSAEKDHIS